MNPAISGETNGRIEGQERTVRQYERLQARAKSRSGSEGLSNLTGAKALARMKRRPEDEN